ncbi:MAG: TfoX/Sxy family protein [Cyclobacteriaceae bacterium]
MAYDEHLADRVRSYFQGKKIHSEEKKMMGGLCFMVDNKMCVGVDKNRLMARIGPEVYDQALAKAGCQPMDFTGRPLKGFVFVEPEGIDLEDDLGYWLQLCLDFNPKAKASKKKKKAKP